MDDAHSSRRNPPIIHFPPNKAYDHQVLRSLDGYQLTDLEWTVVQSVGNTLSYYIIAGFLVGGIGGYTFFTRKLRWSRFPLIMGTVTAASTCTWLGAAFGLQAGVKDLMRLKESELLLRIKDGMRKERLRQSGGSFANNRVFGQSSSSSSSSSSSPSSLPSTSSSVWDKLKDKAAAAAADTNNGSDPTSDPSNDADSVSNELDPIEPANASYQAAFANTANRDAKPANITRDYSRPAKTNQWGDPVD